MKLDYPCLCQLSVCETRGTDAWCLRILFEPICLSWEDKEDVGLEISAENDKGIASRHDNSSLIVVGKGVDNYWVEISRLVQERH